MKKELTKAEEQLMRILWRRKQAFVREVMEELPDPKPAYNTVSTIIRILESKGFVTHQEFGKSHRYEPLVSQSDYLKTRMNEMVEQYFGNSPRQLVSFFARNEKISLNEANEIIELMEHIKKNTLND